MSGLLDSLTSASSALNAQRMGMDVVGQNIANVNTPGYSRRQLVLAEIPATDPSSAGRGAEVVSVQGLRDPIVADRLRSEQQAQSFSDAQVQSLSTLQTAVGLPGSGLDATLSSFFDAFSTLASDVTSPNSRAAVVSAGQSLASGFNNLSNQIAAARQDADSTIRADIDQVNTLAQQVASYNGQIRTTAAGSAAVESLKDSRDVALTQLAQLVGVTVNEQTDGSVDVALSSGQSLVVGDTAFAVSATSAPPSGYAAISVQGTDVTSQLTQGEVGGLLQVRDTTLSGYATQLDQLAYDVATQVNAIHATGYDASGNPAGNFFVAPTAVAGAAQALAVAPTVAANPQLVAGSGTGASGDNQIASAIANLRNVRAMSGGTATAAEAWAQIVYNVGAGVSSAQADSQTHAQIVQQLQQLRDSTSGVSLDEEAAWLMKYQSAYQASARYFTTVDTALDTLMQMVVL